jgi:glycerate kinase
MKIVLAVDSFKGSLSSIAVINILHDSIERTMGRHEIVKVPVADGGEGTVEALVIATNGEYRSISTVNAFGSQIEATYGVIHHDTAVLEMASVAGLAQVPEKERNPLLASSRCLGELILSVIDAGFKKVHIGIGGSVCNDGGMGMLSALGARFYDDQDELLFGRGEDLESVARIDLSGLDKRLSEVDISVICDVTNTLLGEQGATHIYGPQKGAVGEIMHRLEAGMKRYAEVFAEMGIDIVSMPGAGAAGGVGAALGCVLNARLKRGIDSVLNAVRFDELLVGADLVVTGEGRLDGQSVRYGKVPVGITKRCGEKGIPVAIIVGSVSDGWEAIFELAKCSVFTTIDSPMSLERAMMESRELLKSASDRMFRFINLLK